MQAVIMEVIDLLRNVAMTRIDLVSNPMGIIGIGMNAMNKYPDMTGREKRAVLVNALTTIASGPDGQLGTADDKIPKPIVDTIVSLIEGKLIQSVINFASDVSKGRFNVNEAVEVAKETEKTCSGCFAFVLSKLKKKKVDANIKKP